MVMTNLVRGVRKHWHRTMMSSMVSTQRMWFARTKHLLINSVLIQIKIIAVPTFVSFLRDIESPFEVKDYIRMYLGEWMHTSE